jgi:predicted nucleic acid-binding Zn ribbon protein
MDDRHTMKKPKPIRSILERTLKGLELDGQVKAYSIWGAWKEIVGESVASQTQPRIIRNKILFVDVSHSTWIQQLQFLKTTLLEKINAFLGEPLIQDIRFHLGKISSPSLLSMEESWQRENLDEETAKRIEELLERITDGETRKVLRNVLVGGAKVERHRERSG